MRRVLLPSHVPTLAPLAPRAAQVVSEVVSLAGEALGTTWSVKAVTRLSERDLHSIIEPCLSLVVAQMSQWEPRSELSRFNAAPAGSRHRLSREFFHVVQSALQLARDTDGAYDPTIGALTELWGFGASPRRADMPDETAIEAALQSCGWQRLSVDATQRSVVQPGGLQIDLSSIGKGFAVDLVSQTLLRRGIADHLVEIGGELRGSGTKPDHSPWWVAIEGSEDLVVALHGLSIATSGDARRYIKRDGVRLSHTLDPRSGRPISDRLASVTVLAPSCMRADAIATALLVLGLEQGFRFAVGEAIAARFVTRTEEGIDEHLTPAMAAMLE